MPTYYQLSIQKIPHFKVLHRRFSSPPLFFMVEEIVLDAPPCGRGDSFKQ